MFQILFLNPYLSGFSLCQLMSIAVFAEVRYLGVTADSSLSLTLTASALVAKPCWQFLQNIIHSITTLVQVTVLAYLYCNSLLTGFSSSTLADLPPLPRGLFSTQQLEWAFKIVSQIISFLCSKLSNGPFPQHLNLAWHMS